MVSSLQVYVPFKLNFIQHILFMPIIIKAIKKLLYLCFCSYRIPLVHPLANRSKAAAFSSFCHGWSYDGTKNNGSCSSRSRDERGEAGASENATNY